MLHDFRNLSRDMQKLKGYIQRDLPRVIGKEAVNHFKANFDKEGFDGNKWKPVKRIGRAHGADSVKAKGIYYLPKTNKDYSKYVWIAIRL